MKKLLFSLFTAVAIFSSLKSTAQCTVTAAASSTDIYCGDTVLLTAVGNGVTAFRNNFNCCDVQCPAGNPANPGDNYGNWLANPASAQFNSPCKPSPDGSCVIWFNESTPAPRELATQVLDLTAGGNIIFDMLWGPTDGAAPPCEKPDAPDEGIRVQFKVGAGPWTDIINYDPTTTAINFGSGWQHIILPIPNAARFANVQIRWYQKSTTGTLNKYRDNWGLDNCEIVLNPPAVTYTWLHTNSAQSTANTPPVFPTTTTTYTVQYQYSGCVQTASVTVNVKNLTVSASANPVGPVCPGNTVQLSGTVNTADPIPTSCGLATSSDCKGTYSTIRANIGGTVGNDAGPAALLYPSNQTAKHQLIYTAAELTALGMRAGTISELGFNITSIYTDGSGGIYFDYVDNFQIQIGCTNKSEYNFGDGTYIGGLNTVYTASRQTFVVGQNTFPLSSSFTWDGVSNICVSFCFKNNGSTQRTQMRIQSNNTSPYMVCGESSTSASYNYCSGQTSPSEYIYRPIISFGFCAPYLPVIDWTWTPTGAGYNPNATSQNPKVNPTVTTTYTLTAKKAGSPAACNASASVTVNVATVGSVDAQYDPACQGSTLQLKSTIAGSTSGITFNWTGPGGFTANNQQNPTRNPAVAGRYYVTATNGTCSGKDSIDVVLDIPPKPGKGYNDSLCIENTTPYSLFTKLTNTPQAGGGWASTPGYSPDGSAGLSGATVTASALPIGTYKYTYTVTNNNTCGTRDTVVFIKIKPRNFPGKDSSFTICNSASTVTLYNCIGHGPGNRAYDPGGTWTDVNTPTVGARFTPGTSVFNVNGLAPGVYKFRYKVAANTPCGADSATVSVTVTDRPDAGTDATKTICNAGGTMDLFANLGGTPDPGGTWTAMTGTGGGTLVSNIFDPANSAAGTYQFRYIIALAGCLNDTSFVNVTVSRQNPAGGNGATTVCNTAGVIQLFPLITTNSSGAPPTSGGTWTDINTPAQGAKFNAGAGTYDVTGVAAGTYKFKYKVNNAAPCKADSAIVSVTVEVPPKAGTGYTDAVCQTNNNYDLFAKLTGGPQAGGSWASSSGYSPNGTSGLVGGNTLNVSQLPIFPGTYKFTYSVTSNNSCGTRTSEAVINVEKAPFAGEDATAAACNNDVLNLFNFLGRGPGNQIADGGGTWTDLTVPPVGGGRFNAAAGTFDATGLAPGTFKFKYAVAAGAKCPADDATITLNVINNPKTGQPGTASICNDGGTLDLFTVLTGSYDAGGAWTSTNPMNGGTLTSNIYNPLNATAGTYNFSYTINASGCPTSQTAVQVTVNRRPNAGKNGDTTVCETSAALGLMTILDGTPQTGGTFKDPTSGTMIASPYSVTGKGGNTYNFEYRITGQGACKDSAAMVKIVVNHQPKAGNDVNNAKICYNGSVNLFSLITGSPETGGTWSKVGTFKGTLDATTGDYAASGTATDTGTVNFIYVIKATAPCKNDTAFVKLKINGYPVISNLALACSANRKTYTATFNVSGGDRATYNSSVSGGSFSGAAPNYTYTSPAFNSATTHTIVISDGNGCGSDEVEVVRDCQCTTTPGTMDQTPLSLCFGQNTPGTLHNGGFNSDGDDKLTFYLHEGNDKELINVKATSKTSTAFSFNSATMQYGTTYYVSAGAGNDSSGFASRKDICFSIAIGTPVVWHPLPQANISGNTNICPGSTTQIAVDLTTGTAPYDIDLYSRNTKTGATQTDSKTGLNDPDFIDVSPTDTTEYELRFVKDFYGCANTYASNVPVTVNVNVAPVATISDNVQCSDGASSLGSFDINVSGAGSQFSVVYGNSLDTNTTTLAITPPSTTVTATNYDANAAVVYTLLSVSDNSGSVCPGVVNGSATVYPVPSAVISGNQTICPSANVDLTFNFTGIGPWNVIFHDGNGGADQSFTTSSNPYVHTIPNPGPGNYTYQIRSVVDNGSGAAACSSTGSGSAAVTVNSSPKIDLLIADSNGNNRVVNDEYCDGAGPRRLYFVLDPVVGSGNRFNLTYTEDGITRTQIVTRPEGFVTVNPLPAPTSHTYTFVSITDTTSAACPGTGTSATIKVNPNPVVNFLQIDSVICIGQQAEVQFQISGIPKVKYNITTTNPNDGNSYQFQDDPGTVSHYFTPAVPGNYTYQFSVISDGSTPTCTSTQPGTFRIKVNQVPTAAMIKDSVELCFGDPLVLTYTTTTSAGDTVKSSFSYPGGPGYQISRAAGASYTYTPSITNLPPGNYTYGFGSVSDQKGCPGTAGKSTFVRVRPKPTVAAVIMDSIICAGTPANLILTCTGNGPFSVDYKDEANQTYTQSVPASGTATVAISPTTYNRTFTITQVRDNTDPEGPNTSCSATITGLSKTLTVNPLPVATLSGTREVCQGGTDSVHINIASGVSTFSVRFTDQNNRTYPTFSGLGLGDHYLPIGFAPNDSLVFTGLVIEDSSSPTHCQNTIGGNAYLNVNPNPRPNFTPDKTGGCSPLDVTFVNNPETNYLSAACVWDFDDNSPQEDNCGTVQHTFIDQTIYNVSLTVTSQQGCTGSVTRQIVVYPDPVADFSWEPDPVTMSNSYVRFFNESFGGAQYHWDIEGVGSYDEYAPVVQFPAEDTGTYPVCLLVTTGFGCTDTICKDIVVNGEMLINIPNTFTPDQDGKNDVWKPVCLGFRPEFYSLTVFDRWGQPIFSTNDPEVGWSGVNKQNEMCQVGVYAYRLDIKSKFSGEKVRKIGNINLIK